MTIADIDLPEVISATPPQTITSAEGMNSIDTQTHEVKNYGDPQPLDDESLYLINRLKGFRSRLRTLGESARTAYTKAIASLDHFMRRFSLQYEPLTTRLLTDWLLTLRLDGLSPSTITLYLNAISSLSSSGPEADFTLLRARLASDRNHAPSHPARRLPVKECRESELISPALLRDIHTAAVILGGVTLESAARLRRADLGTLPTAIADRIRRIAAPYADPRRRYLFPLDQTAHTPRQLARRIAQSLALATDPAIRRLTSPADTWFRQALSLGATPTEAIAALRQRPAAAPRTINDTTSPLIPGLTISGSPLIPDDLPPLSDEAVRRLRENVAEAIAANPIHWYALRLRQGVDTDELECRLRSLTTATADTATPPSRLSYTIFNPLHRISRHETAPILPGITFIRIRVADLQPLLADIGDIAWCYRDPALRDRGYAAIPDPQMNAFQLAIGVFTEETTVAPLGTIPPRPGQKIIILGGPLAGLTGSFEKTVATTSTGDTHPTRETATPDAVTHPIPDANREQVLYRLTLPGLNGIEWVADLDPRLLQTLSDPTNN